MRASLSGVCALLVMLVAAGAADAQLRLRPYLTGLSAPLAIVSDPTNASVQFVVEQAGVIRVVRNGALTGTFLDLTSVVLSGGERGLFSIAFPPDAATSGRFFVYFTRKPDGGIVVARFRRSADPLVADPASRMDFVWPDGQAFIAHPNGNHNGGHMVFGFDGYLYIGTGDGGSGDDPPNNAQNPMQLLGKILRVDVGVPDADPHGYAIPADNPFASGLLPGTAVPVRSEIWAVGMRNPWRFNFDDVARGGTGALVIADVGQNAWEEIDYEPAGHGGRNYGWRSREGAHAHIASPPPAYTPLTDPVFEYAHNGASASITGGYVYRGTALGPAFTGRYFFADFIQARVWSIALIVDPVTGEAHADDLREHTAELGGAGVIGNVSSFGVDADGELFVIAYAGAVLRLTPRGPADLVVSGVTAPAIGVSGRPLTIPNRVRNIGDQTAAGPFRVDIYMSPDSDVPGAGSLVGSRTIAALAAGAESVASTVVTVPPTAAPGLYSVSAVVDADNVVVESDDANNGGRAPTRMEIVRPDLAMMSVVGPARGVIGKPIVVTTTVKNVGRAAAGAFTIGLHLSGTNTPGSGQRIAVRAVAGLAPGASATLVTSATIPPDTARGPYFISAVADSDRTVVEIGDADDGTNAANNGLTASALMQVVPFLPDLEIAAVSAPFTMAVARPLTVTFTARNSGPAPAGAFRVSFFLAPVTTPPPAPGDGINVGSRMLAGIAAGASLVTTAVVNVPGNLSENTYYLSAVADVEGAVDEVTDDVVAKGRLTPKPITVVRPDLRIVRFEASVPPATARAARGGTLAVRNLTVRNVAVAPAATGAFTLKFYLSDDPVLDALDTELAPAPRSAGLAPGGSWALAPMLTIPPSVGTGAKFLIARVDALEEIFEADETNNTLAIPVEIGDFVDLQITAVGGPLAVATGRPMTASFTVRNAGTAPAGPFRVSVFMAPGVDPTPGAGVELGARDLAGLGTGAAFATTLVVNVPADFAQGLYSLSAVADPGNVIPELGGNDSVTFNGRVAPKPISVVRPDLQVFRLTGPPRAGRGGTVTVSTTVRNGAAAPGTAPASTLKFYLSDDDVYDAQDLELSPARAIPALGPGAISTVVTTLLIPPSASTGPKFLIARADALEAMLESDESNNTAALPIEIGDFVDLGVVALAGPISVRAGAPMTVGLTVRNAGTVPAGPFRVTFFLVQPAGGRLPGDGVVIGVKDIAGLGAGASVATSAIVSVPPDLTPGGYALSAVADADNAIPEVVDGVSVNGLVATRAISVLAPAP